jgi:hypothetical protein
LVIDHVYIYQSGRAAIYGEGAGWANGKNQGSPVLTTIQNSLLRGGITIDTCGDTVRILNNAITGAGKAIDVSFQSGASTFILSGNNITSDGGIHLGTHATAAQILSNEIETLTKTSMGSNDATIDIDGSAADIMIQNNSIQIVNQSQADGIRVNDADRTLIVGNRFGRGECKGCTRNAVGVRVGANAVDTLIGTNTWPGAFSSRVLCVGADWKTPVSCGSTSTVLATASDNAFVLQAGTVELQAGTVEVRAATETGSVKLDGRGSFFLGAEAACLASGASDRFLKWSAGDAQTCAQACGAVTCNAAATCVKGWTMWAGTVHYQYGSECTTADPSAGQGMSGKLCCCVGSGCAQPMYK